MKLMWVSIQHTPSLSLVFALISPSLLLIVHICIFFFFFFGHCVSFKELQPTTAKETNYGSELLRVRVHAMKSPGIETYPSFFFFHFLRSAPAKLSERVFFLPLARVRRHCFEVVTNDACLLSRDLTEHTVSVTTDRQHSFFFFPSSWWNGKKKTPFFFLACRRLSAPLLGDLNIQFEFPQHALTVFQQTPTHFHEPQYCFCLFHYFFFFGFKRT